MFSERNYAAWSVEPEDFFRLEDDGRRLRFLVRFGVLAPSSHNSQPWRFLVGGDSIIVAAEAERYLPVADRDGRLMHIALGCAARLILIAADYFGYRADIEYLTGRPEDGVIRLRFTKPARFTRKDADHLVFQIAKRRSNRAAYGPRVPDLGFLSPARAAFPDVACEPVSDAAKRSSLTDVLLDFRERSFDVPDFRREMAGYKRTNMTGKYTGMPGFTMGFGFVQSLIAPFMIRSTNVIRLTRPHEAKLLKEQTPLLVFCGTNGDSRREWLDAGQAFTLAAVEAQRNGVQTAVSIFSPQERKPLADILGVDTALQFFFRAGFSGETPGHSPRIPAEDVIVATET